MIIGNLFAIVVNGGTVVNGSVYSNGGGTNQQNIGQVQVALAAGASFSLRNVSGVSVTLGTLGTLLGPQNAVIASISVAKLS